MKDKLRPTRWGKTILSGWAAIILIALFIHYGPAAETRLFPVTSKFKIVSLNPHEAGVLFRFEFDKRRQCTLESLTWYKRVGDFRIAYVPMKMDGMPFIDQWTGEIRSSQFFLPMAAEEIRLHSFATTRHRCHGLWDTITLVYP